MANIEANVRIRASVPFSFQGEEGYIQSNKRGGWSIFRLIGVIEKCESGLTTSNDLNWKYAAHTDLKLTNPTNNYNNYGVDRSTCAIAFDGTPGRFYGELQMNTTLNVNSGDHLRFRIYLMSLRKMWASNNSGTSMAPGYVSLRIGAGTDRNFVGYRESNEGFLEIFDPNTYINTSTNILNNEFSKEIEKFRYSIVDFNLDNYVGDMYQGTQSGTNNLPTIYLLNNPPQYPPNGFSRVINHADPNQTGEFVPGNKKEYFYNRDPLQLFFVSSTSFDAYFSKLSFLESDMIPFFVYATESNINRSIQVPLSGTSSTIS